MDLAQDEHPHLRHVRAYLRALETNADESQLRDFFCAAVVQRELPNRLVPGGAERNLEQICEGSRKGQTVVEGQRFDVKTALVMGDRVALEVTWTARLKLPLGKLLPGDTMTAHCGFFFRMQDGRIAEQHNYDCFEAF
jgi:ketosteroid isomerase-like protein